MESNKISPARRIAACMVFAAIVLGIATFEEAPAFATNPCAANPCGAANPCAANPCVANPCGAANPCAANPCAAQPVVVLSNTAAADTYDRIAKQLHAGYVESGDPVAAVYFNWQRYNMAPYISETHGRRYVNNYANTAASAYGGFEEAGVMPQGSVLAKDSFRVVPMNPCATVNPCAANPCATNPCSAGTGSGLQPGPLFIMEKMVTDFNRATGDWRYTMIMPDGSIFGRTDGPGSAKMQFCADCHGAVGDKQDHLYFLPEEYR